MYLLARSRWDVYPLLLLEMLWFGALTTYKCKGSSQVWSVYMAVLVTSPVAAINYPTKATEGKGRSHGHSASWWWSRVIRNLKQLVPLCPWSGRRELRLLPLSWLFPFYSVQDPVHKMSPPLFRVYLPNSTSRKSPIGMPRGQPNVENPSWACSEALFWDDSRACHTESHLKPLQIHSLQTWHFNVSFFASNFHPLFLPSQNAKCTQFNFKSTHTL